MALLTAVSEEEHLFVVIDVHYLQFLVVVEHILQLFLLNAKGGLFLLEPLKEVVHGDGL